MKKFKIEFVRAERSICSVSINAETPEEALKVFRSGEYNEDEHEEETLDSEIENPIECVGEWVPEKERSGIYSLNRFETPVE